jgi:hypothetical protein
MERGDDVAVSGVPADSARLGPEARPLAGSYCRSFDWSVRRELEAVCEDDVGHECSVEAGVGVGSIELVSESTRLSRRNAWLC